MAKQRQHSGCIDWPTGNGYTTSTDRNGMWVYAFWLTDYSEPVDVGLALVTKAQHKLLKDPFVHCEGPQHTITLPKPYCTVGGNASRVYPPELQPEPAAAFGGDTDARGRYLRWTYDAGAQVLAAVCLGTSAAVYVDTKTETYWQATTDALTRKGRKLVQALNELYGPRHAELVTYVDMASDSPV